MSTITDVYLPRMTARLAGSGSASHTSARHNRLDWSAARGNTIGSEPPLFGALTSSLASIRAAVVKIPTPTVTSWRQVAHANWVR